MPSNSLNRGSSPEEPEEKPEDRLNIREEFDEAIIGVSERIGETPVIAYDTTKIVEVLSRSMSVDEAYEYFEFNILGAYVGHKTPVFITTSFKQ